MMRLIGALLIIIALGSAGWIYAARYNGRIKELEDWRQAIRWCDMEINYRLLPLAEVLKLAAERLDGKVAVVFSDCATGIIAHQSADRAWQEALDKYLPDSCLGREDADFLRRFGAVLGKSDLAQQNKNFAFLEENLEQALLEARREKTAKVKIYRYLGVSCGLALVVILL